MEEDALQYDTNLLPGFGFLTDPAFASEHYFGWESSPGDYSPFILNRRIETALCAKNIIVVRLMCTYMAMGPGFKGPFALFLYV